MIKEKNNKLTTQELNHPSLQPTLRGLTLAFRKEQANYLSTNNIKMK